MRPTEVPHRPSAAQLRAEVARLAEPDGHQPTTDSVRRSGPRVVVRGDLGVHQDAWDTLVAAATLPTPFLRSWWFESSRHPRPRFVLVLDGDELIGGMALQEDRLLGVPCYRVLGHSWLAPDHLDVVTAEDRRAEVEAALRRWCRRPGDRVFDLDGVAEDNGFARVLPPPIGSTRMTIAPYRRLDAPTDGEAPEPSGRARTATRRGRRKLAKLGGEHRVVRGAAVDAALERFRDLHERRWQDGSGFLALYERFADAARVGARRGEVVVHELVVDGRVHASLVEFWLAGHAYFYQHGRDPDAPVRSAGTVVMSYALEHAARSGATEYDLLRGTESYKDDWADAERALLRLRSASGARGKIALTALRRRQELGALKGRVRRWILARGERAADGARAAKRRLLSIGQRPRTRGASHVITDPASLPDLRDQWDQLQADPPCPSTQLDHITSQASVLGDDEGLCVVVVEDEEGRLTGAAPLVRSRSGARRLRLLDTGAASSFLYADEDQLDRLVDAILALHSPLNLDALVVGSPSERAIRSGASRWLLRSRERLGGPSLPIDASWTEPLEKLSRRRHKDLLRSRGRAERIGQVEFENETPGERVGACFDELVQVEARSWKSRAGTALAQDHGQREALRRYLTAPSVRDSVVVDRMRIDGTTAAIDIGVVIGDRYWGLKGGVDDAFRPGAPGLQLKAFTIANAAAAGLARVEFMGSSAAWKEMWGAGPVRLRQLRAYPPNPAGARALTRDLTTKCARALLARLVDLRQRASSKDPRNPKAGDHRRGRHRSDRQAARRALRRPGVHVAAGQDRTVQVLTRPDELESLREDWRRLQADVPGPSSHLDWVLAFAWGLPARDRLCVVTTHESGRLTGVAPLVRRRGLVRRLELVILGAAGFRYRDAGQAGRLVDAVLGLPLPLRLDLLVAGSATERHVADHPKRGRLTLVSALDGGGGVQLDERYAEDPTSVLGRNSRKDLRRRRRRAAELGELRFETIAPGDDIELLRRLFDDLVRIEARGWKGRAGTALASDARRREMAWRHTSAPEVRPKVRISTLHIGDELVAVDLSLVEDGRWWCEKGGYDEAWAKLSPGHLLTIHTIQRAAREGCTRLELGGVSERYKEDWASPLPLRTLKLYPATLAGLVAVIADAGGKARRHLGQIPARAQELGATVRRRIPSRGRDQASGGGAHADDVVIVRTADGLESLREDWDQLRTEVPGPSSHIDHVQATALAVEDDAELVVVTTRDDGRLTGVAPLLRTGGHPSRVRLATREATEFLYADRSQLERLVDAVIDLGEPMVLETVLADSPTDEVVRERVGRAGLLLTNIRRAGPSMQLDDSFAEPLERLSGRRRSDLRRKFRKAEDMGRVDFDVRPAAGDLAERFDEFLRIEAGGWKGRAGTALVDDDRQRAQLWHYLSSPAIQSTVWVARMLIDDVPVATDLVVIAARRYWFIKGSYDERYGACSPGMLLKVHTVGWAAREGLERFEFMGETEPYKEAWGASAQTLRTLRFYPARPVGLAAFGVDAADKAVRVIGRLLRRAAGR